MMQSDSELVHQRRLAVRLAKRLVIKPLLSFVSAFLVIGDNNEEYYRHYGVHASRFFRCPYPMDEESFVNMKERSGRTS